MASDSTPFGSRIFELPSVLVDFSSDLRDIYAPTLMTDLHENPVGRGQFKVSTGLTVGYVAINHYILLLYIVRSTPKDMASSASTSLLLEGPIDLACRAIREIIAPTSLIG